MLIKPAFNAPLSLQDDHFRRFADLSFRHLSGAWDNHRRVQLATPFVEIDSDDAEWGRAEHLQQLGSYQFHKSEEYSQACASILLAHAWLLSAANYYRLAVEYGHVVLPEGAAQISATSSPSSIVEALGLGI